MNDTIEKKINIGMNLQNTKYKCFIFIIEIEDRENGLGSDKTIYDLKTKFKTNGDFYKPAVRFFDLGDIQQFTKNQLIGWWDEARWDITAKKFQDLNVRENENFSEKDYLQEVIKRICEECDRSELFDELFIILRKILYTCW